MMARQHKVLKLSFKLAFHKAISYLSKKDPFLNFVLQIQIQKMEKLLTAIMLYDLITSINFGILLYNMVINCLLLSPLQQKRANLI